MEAATVDALTIRAMELIGEKDAEIKRLSARLAEAERLLENAASILGCEDRNEGIISEIYDFLGPTDSASEGRCTAKK